MCGIFFSLSRQRHIPPDSTISAALLSRGPDGSKVVQRVLKNHDTYLYMNFMSTVLSLRGTEVVNQPVSSRDSESVLCWNGEAWKIGSAPLTGSDTKRIFEDLLVLSLEQSYDYADQEGNKKKIERYMAGIQGPYAFVFYDALSSLIFFGRDAIGRRSLIIQNDADKLVLSSVVSTDLSAQYHEITPNGIYCIDLRQHSFPLHTCTFSFNLTQWRQLNSSDGPKCSKRYPLPIDTINKDLCYPLNRDFSQRSSVAKGRVLLLRSLCLRLTNVPRRGLTGGNDEFQKAVGNSRYSERIGILFSGGLDCTILARLSHDLIPIKEPVALLNVAFENPRLVKNQCDENYRLSSFCESCPDRVTARKSFAELKRTCPGRKWKFVAINISYEESKLHRAHIISLMRPHATEMDLSIAMALYFASRGDGLIQESNVTHIYKTPARVLLSGLGADEIFGGYTRHEVSYNRGGLKSLIDELELDISRIGQRNLGRDDRVTANWAKEIRYPFLDEEFLRWALALPVWSKCAFHARDAMELEGIEPGKYLLRLLALSLDLKQTAKEKKRAIQFGSRSAKMNDCKTKGSDGIH